MNIAKRLYENGRHREDGVDKVKTTEEIGRVIRARRKELGYTQAFLADYAGVSASFLSELENGKDTIQLGKAMTIMSLLGMDMAVMKRGE